MSRERGRQMSRGPAQPGRWRREVRALGRSPRGSRAPELPSAFPLAFLPSGQKGQTGAAESQGPDQHFGSYAGGIEKGNRATDLKTKSCNFAKEKATGKETRKRKVRNLEKRRRCLKKKSQLEKGEGKMGGEETNRNGEGALVLGLQVGSQKRSLSGTRWCWQSGAPPRRQGTPARA